MKEMDNVSLEIKSAIKTYRSAIRLKHSLIADAEINDSLPALERAMYEAAATGKPYKVDLAAVFAA